MQFGAFSYAYSTNLGDEIQTLSAAQFLPRIDFLIERDRLYRYQHCPSTFVIFNGWFNQQPSWPPPDSLSPLFVAFYAARPEWLIDRRFVGYFKRHEPIGCRSLETAEAFRKIGVDAYFSGCLTLTLRQEPVVRTDKIYTVDVDPDLFANLVPNHIKRDIVHISPEGLPPDLSVLSKAEWTAARLGLRGLYKWDSEGSVLRAAGERLNRLRHASRASKARQLLKLYASAKLIITSRLHCALPCLALGTPVVLLRRGVELDPRFAGLRELVRFHSDPSQPIKIDWRDPEPNSDMYLVYAKPLRERCESAVRDISNSDTLTPVHPGTAVLS